MAGPGLVSAEEAELGQVSTEELVTGVWAETCCQTEQTEVADPGAEGGLPTAEVGVWPGVLRYRRQ